MRWFHNLDIRWKLLLFIAPLVLGVLALAGLRLHEAQLARVAATQTAALAQLSHKAGALVHQLQRERGLSAIYLGGEPEAWERLQTQRRATDQALSHYRGFYRCRMQVATMARCIRSSTGPSRPWAVWRLIAAASTVAWSWAR
ncbi:hypothetical protein CAI21_08795 [Alkalilimnicola ehrlichii]|uniref:Nitrate/nitrite sensing protein domain-containing protein n=1 Tax=Alkalilimnicola ehrlichii TaxID=351052 RepID=A0A3E0WU32_9GAMM|nr:hypothetical protein CAI21_08795 [Alkalilimnicola ehrlichii]RFA36502.1 hypothetical protein CAL65_11070 [Alkalilimnicola ehrlichii]